MTSIPLKYRLRAMAGSLLRRRIGKARGVFLAGAKKQCRQTQHRLLRDLLRLNQESQFSKDFGLSGEMTPEQFRSRIPVSDYELVRPYIQRVAAGESSALLGRSNRLLMFAVTSGTTAEPKLIPVTKRFLNDYRSGWQMWGIGTYSEHSLLQKLNIVQISSSHRRFATSAGIPCGNISGLVAAMQNPVVRTLYTVTAAVAEISDAEAKRYVTLRLALADPFVGMLITANPSTLLQLAEDASLRAADLLRDIYNGEIRGCELPESVRLSLRGALKASPHRARRLEQILEEQGYLRPRHVWPLLGVLGVWCGGSAAAYVPRLRSLFDDIPIRDHGLHASEGRMTLPLEDNCTAGVLEIQTHFFEFVPVREAESTNPVVLEADELEVGQDYFILMTTSSGLYRYNIRDVVRCVGYYGASPLLEFRHKGAHISSITGEKIAESQVVEAVRTASVSTGVSPRIYTLTPNWGEPPGYTLFVDEVNPCESEYSGSASSVKVSASHEHFATEVDTELQKQNVEYEEKRGSGRLQAIQVVELPDKAWKTYTLSRQNRFGGSVEQYKHPCLVPDPQFEKTFLRACGLP